MRTHTQEFRNQIIEMGREIDSKITYTIDDEMVELDAEMLNSITPSFQGSILKSVMKQLIIDANVDIPRGTEINYKFGLKVNGEYEYLDFGNYIVEKSTRKEDTRSYEIECYDAMIKTMVDYEDMALVYPISIRDYLNEISAYFNLTFKNINDDFANYDKEIPDELYLGEDGSGLGYTFRDVLDELAQVTASTICINNNNELEVRYITDTEEIFDEEYLKDVNVTFGEKYGPINSVVLSRSGESDNVFLQDEESVANNGLCEVKIIDNQIMNDNNRADYLPSILERLNGLEYYLNDFSSTGITYLELCDKYYINIFGNTYTCVLFNDEILVTQGLQENIYTELPEETETDYKTSDTDDRKINKAFILVNKQNQTIEALTSKVSNLDTTIENNQKEIMDKFDGYVPQSQFVQLENSVLQSQTDTYTKTEINTKLTDGSVTKVKTTSGTFDEDGMHYEKTGAETSSTINEKGVTVEDATGYANNDLLYAGYVDEAKSEENPRLTNLRGQTVVYTKNSVVDNYFIMGSYSRMEDYEEEVEQDDGTTIVKKGTGVFYLGG